MNLVLGRWSNRGVNLWKVSLTSTPLTAGLNVITVDPAVINVLDTYLTRTDAAQPVDTLLSPIDRAGWASLTQKTQTGAPTLYWFDRTLAPTLTLWPVPDQSGVYVLSYWVWKQIQDANPQMGQVADISRRFLEAFTAEVAAHLAMKFAPGRFGELALYAKTCWDEASNEDHEKVALVMAPDLGGYF